MLIIFSLVQLENYTAKLSSLFTVRENRFFNPKINKSGKLTLFFKIIIIKL